MTVETEQPGFGRAERPNLIGRVKRILLEPKAEWERIDAEQTSVGEIIRGWVLILAAVPAVANLIGSVVFGYSLLGVTYRPSIMEAVASAIMQYVFAVAGVFVLALVIDWLAPKFGGTANWVQATKVAAYSATAAWVAGIFGILPSLAVLGLLGLYSSYLLYLGLPRLMKTPADKAMSFTVVTIVAAVALALLAGAIVAPVTALFASDRASVSSGQLSGTVSVPGAGQLDLQKLEEASKQLEASTAQLQSGSAQGAAAAVAPATLQALLPESLGSYRRTEVSSSGSAAGGFGGSQVEAHYENGPSNISLQVVDMAAAGPWRRWGMRSTRRPAARRKPAMKGRKR